MIKLNPREMEILNWLSLGKQSRDIAELIGIRPNHVGQYVSRIKNKMGAGTAAGAVAIALRTGLLH